MNSNVFSYIYIYVYIYININININIYRETSTVYCPGELDGWTSAAILAVLVFP